jgi:hypothetical protein
MIVRCSQEHEERSNRRSASEVLKALQFRIAEHLFRETARLLPTAGFSTHDNTCLIAVGRPEPAPARRVVVVSSSEPEGLKLKTT